MNCQEAIDVMGDVLEGAEGRPRPGYPEFPGLDEHLSECGPCRNYLDQLSLTRRALRRLSSLRLPNPDRDALIDRFREESKDS